MSNTDTCRMLGYKNFRSYIELGSFGDKSAFVDSLFDTCHRWEIARYLSPQGPLKLEALDEDLLSRWKADIDAGRVTISDCLEQLCGSAECPVPQNKEFWQKYRGISRQTGSSSEDAFDALGTLVYRVSLSKTPNSEVRIRLSPAVIGASRRLWRGYPSRRLIRVHVPEDLYRELACLEAVLGHQSKAYRRNFDATMYKEIHIMGARFRLYYSKPGSQSFMLWAEQTARPEDPIISLMDFCNELIPLCHPYNQGLSLAKLSARYSLWLSQTIPIPLDAKIQVRWVPDLTNKTLGITYAGMESLSKAFGLDYVPTCITGTIGDGRDAIRYTWSRYHHRKELKQSKKTICLFNDLLDYQSEWVEIEFQLHCDGAKRTEKRLKQIFEQEDVDYTVEQPHHPEKVMTDGCAMMSFKLAQAVQQARGMTHVPCAVQARLAGCKGVWSLDLVPDTKDPVPWIEVRDSQHKCAVDERWFTFEVLRTESVSKGVNLGEQTATVLRQAQPEVEARNVIDKRLAELELNELEHLHQIFDFERSDPTTLRTFLEKRMSHPFEATSNTQESQAQSLSTHNYGDVEEDDVDLDGVESGCRPNPSGYPATSEERCVAMIDAGYSLDDPMFRQELQLIQASVTKSRGKLRIPVENARHLLVIADQWDCLSRPDDLFCQLSDLPIDPETNLRGSNVLEGPVLINRNPCVQDSDIQKCTAVDVRSLKHFRDLVIVPAIGARSVLSKLSSGDYDGDTVNITWDQPLTEPWSNTSEHVDPPFESDLFFKKAEYSTSMGESITQVKELVSMYRQLDELTEEHVRFLQRIMCGPGLLPPAYGRLSVLHTELTTLADVRSPFVSALGHLYTSSLDAAKAGTWFRLAHLNLDALWDRLSIELESMGIKPVKKVTAGVAAELGRKRSLGEEVCKNASALQAELGQMPTHGIKTSKIASIVEKDGVSADAVIRASSSHQSLIGFPVTKTKSLMAVEDATLSRSKSAPEALSVLGERQVAPNTGQLTSVSLNDPDFLLIWPGGTEHYPGSRFMQSCAEKALEKYIGYVANVGRSTQHYREARRRTSARARLAPELLKIFEDFWHNSFETIQRHPPSTMPGPYLGWKHIVAAATYYVASRSKASDYVRTTFPAVFCWQWLLDIKAEAVESRTKGTSEGARRIPTERLAELKGKGGRVLAPALVALPTATNSSSPAKAMTAGGSEQAEPCSPAKCRKGEYLVSTPWTASKKVARRMEFESPGGASEASRSKKKEEQPSDEESSDFGDSFEADLEELWEELEELSELKLFQARMEDSGIGRLESSQE